MMRQSLLLQDTTYIYDEAGHHLGKYLGIGNKNPGEEVIYLDDTPIAMTIGGVLSYLETDHLGTPRVAANPTTNTLQWEWDFFGDAFGANAATSAPSGGVDVRLRYPGQYFDGESGLHYNYFRDYEPGTGRYVESDPIGLVGGVSTYAYVADRPLYFSDRKGLWLPNYHYWMTRRAASSARCPKLDEKLANAVSGVDKLQGSQWPINSYWHAMSDGTRGQSASEASAKYHQYLNRQGENICNMSALARAVHAVQDSHSPAHSGFQPWFGTAYYLQMPNQIGSLGWHVAQDFYPSPNDYDSSVQESEGWIRRAISECPCLCN